LVRVDANLDIGSGHLMRCAALGMRLRAKGVRVHFVCVDLIASFADWLRASGFGLTEISADHGLDWRQDATATQDVARQVGPVDLLIVDSYGLDSSWESSMRPYTRRILVIDDLADRQHDCDFLLDQNLHDDAQLRYTNYVPVSARQFLGPRFALLRPEFDRDGLERLRDGSVSNLLVFFGGTDPGNQAQKVVQALRTLGSRSPHGVVVLGPSNPHREALHVAAYGLTNVRVLDATNDMALLMSQADLAIGTCGVAAWERCAMGLPCLVVVTADNQRDDARILAQRGAVEHLGDADSVGPSDWRDALIHAMGDSKRVQQMGVDARCVMEGRRMALTELEGALIDAGY